MEGRQQLARLEEAEALEDLLGGAVARHDRQDSPAPAAGAAPDILADFRVSQQFLVGYSCKRRGVCPSCNARRAHDTAIHLEAAVLPRLAYRQWTLSFPMRLRFLLGRDSEALSCALNLFIRALFAFQRRTARRLGIRRPHTGAVAFVQRFGSALQLTPHFHVLVPEAVFEVEGEPQRGPRRAEPDAEAVAARAHSLPPPDDEEVERLLRTVALRVVGLLRKQGKLDDFACEGVLDCLQGARRASPAATPAGRGARARTAEAALRLLGGFSLHANTRVHENDRDNLRRLCAYGARGPLSLERLSRLPDGRVAYRRARLHLRRRRRQERPSSPSGAPRVFDLVRGYDKSGERLRAIGNETWDGDRHAVAFWGEPSEVRLVKVDRWEDVELSYDLPPAPRLPKGREGFKLECASVHISRCARQGRGSSPHTTHAG